MSNGINVLFEEESSAYLISLFKGLASTVLFVCSITNASKWASHQMLIWSDIVDQIDLDEWSWEESNTYRSTGIQSCSNVRIPINWRLVGC